MDIPCRRRFGQVPLSSYAAWLVYLIFPLILLPGLVLAPPPPPAVLPNPVLQLLTLSDLARYRTDTPLPTYVSSGSYFHFTRASGQNLELDGPGLFANLPASQQLTIFVKRRYTSSGDCQRIFDCGSGAGVDNINFYQYATQPQDQLYLYNGTSGWPTLAVQSMVRLVCSHINITEINK